MKKTRLVVIFMFFYGLLLVAPWWWLDAAQPSASVSEFPTPAAVEIMQAAKSSAALAINSPIHPIPQSVELNKEKVALGERLFHDKRFSHDNSMACVTCHIFKKGGTDNLAHSLKTDGKPTPTNTLTIFNSTLNFRLHWNGEFSRFEDQIDKVLNTVLRSTWEEVIAKLKKDSTYAAEFSKIYDDGIQIHTIKNAIATYERSLITPNSRFDRYLRGDQQAITENEKHGYMLFKSYGCVACHQGINVGGNMYQKFGVMNNYFKDRGNITPADFGLFNITHNEEDRHRFRVASLRNVALTAPYFHDGSARTLKDAVKVMARYQLGRPIPHKDIDHIVAFLHTLTGEYKGRPLSEYE